MGTAGSGETIRDEQSPSPGSRATLGFRLITAFELVAAILGCVILVGAIGAGAGGRTMTLGTVGVGLGFLQTYFVSRLVQLESWAFRWALGVYGVRLLFDVLLVNLLSILLRFFFAAYIFGRRKTF